MPKSSLIMGELPKKKHAISNASTAVRVSLGADMCTCVDVESQVVSSSGQKMLCYNTSCNIFVLYFIQGEAP